MRKTKHLLDKLKRIREVRKRYQLKVKDLMTSQVLTIDSEENVVAAAEKMLENKVHALVVAEGDKPLGIISTYDLILVMTLSDFDKSTKVEEVMVRELVTIKPTEPLNKALKKMIDYNIRRIVVEEEGRVVGILSLIDIILGFSVIPEENLLADLEN
ncbi:MAG: CBS domain-containing protein [Candidatus Altiarchaeales archaeon ex4484_2]|nr:MAG: CBS domain-containing protein [Candidatus Altiarchaeales archaeon ex4484_2]